MNSISSESRGSARRRRRLSTAIKESLRELSIQLSLLNHHVGARVDLKDVDLDCLDLINRHGPLSPGALARRAGLHPATMTGVIDRLELGGWVARDRGTSDRRAILIQALRDRNSELLHLYSGMNTSMDQICAEYGDAELQLLADFLRRTAHAGGTATDELASDDFENLGSFPVATQPHGHAHHHRVDHRRGGPLTPGSGSPNSRTSKTSAAPRGCGCP